MKNVFSRRHFLGASGVAAFTMGVPSASLWAQESFPSKPVKIIVPLPAGGTADASLRIFAEQYQLLAKQNLIIDNKPGGNFQIRDAGDCASARRWLLFNSSEQRHGFCASH